MARSRRATPSEKELGIIRNLATNGGFNFEQLGKAVGEVLPQVLDGTDLVASDYIAQGYTSVVSVWVMGNELTALDDVTGLRSLGGELDG
ncbi:hypothetical protein ABZU25_21645 [Micromonospora sp. NPDC005215]|uniref:hypothetical protein n=1 Tax=Micromonospora sp. NPDC005215 TaxID=3157024 RepID=UPI00339DED65